MKQILYKTILIKAFLLAFIVTIANCSCCCDDTPNHNFTFIQGPPGKRGPPGDVQFVDGNITELRENLAQVTEKLNSILDAKQVQSETSCKGILQNNNSSISGLHKLKDSYGEEYSTYCDMHTDGGGWTLVATIHDNNPFETGRCTVGDRWSSEQGNSNLRPKGENNWANLNVFGRVTTATFDDFKCPGYFDIQARDIMIWHVPNNTPFQNYNVSSYLKYRTTNGFLTQYGGNLQSLYANHFPILSKTYRYSHDNGPAVPVVFDKGDGDSLLQHFAPRVLNDGVEAGFIEKKKVQMADLQMSLTLLQEELKSIRETQNRYEKEYALKPSGAAAVSSFSEAKENSQRSELDRMRDTIERIDSMLAILEKEVWENSRRVDDLEQYSRRNCLVLHGSKNIPIKGSYKEFESYVLHKLNSKLEMVPPITPQDIDTCHILPSRKKSSNVPIIIKFVRRSVRDSIFGMKRKLKAKEGDDEKLAITESLTRRRLELLKRSKLTFGIRHVWTLNGNVNCNFKGKRYVINDFSDIDRLVS